MVRTVRRRDAAAPSQAAADRRWFWLRQVGASLEFGVSLLDPPETARNLSSPLRDDVEIPACTAAGFFGNSRHAEQHATSHDCSSDGAVESRPHLFGSGGAGAAACAASARGGKPAAATGLQGVTRLRLDATLKHLSTMRSAGLLVTSPDRTDGRRMLYSLSPSVPVTKTPEGRTVIDFGFVLLRL